MDLLNWCIRSFDSSALYFAPLVNRLVTGEIYIYGRVRFRHPFECVVEEQGAIGVTERVENVGNQFHAPTTPYATFHQITGNSIFDRVLNRFVKSVEPFPGRHGILAALLIEGQK